MEEGMPVQLSACLTDRQSDTLCKTSSQNPIKRHYVSTWKQSQLYWGAKQAGWSRRHAYLLSASAHFLTLSQISKSLKLFLSRHANFRSYWSMCRLHRLLIDRMHAWQHSRRTTKRSKSSFTKRSQRMQQIKKSWSHTMAYNKRYEIFLFPACMHQPIHKVL